jgi:hypothetical protein
VAADAISFYEQLPNIVKQKIAISGVFADISVVDTWACKSIYEPRFPSGAGLL